MGALIRDAADSAPAASGQQPQPKVQNENQSLDYLPKLLSWGRTSRFFTQKEY